jgi:hypothetical protein
MSVWAVASLPHSHKHSIIESMVSLGHYVQKIGTMRTVKRVLLFATSLLLVVAIGAVPFLKMTSQPVFADTVTTNDLPFTPTAMAASSDGTYVVATQNDNDHAAYFSSDSGATWTQTSTTFTSTPAQTLVASADGQTLFGIGGRYDHSVDGGANWTFSTLTYYSSLSYAPATNKLYGLTGDSSSIVVSSDFGQTWTTAYSAPSGYSFNSVSFSSDGSRLYDVLIDNSSFTTTVNVSTDDGATWTLFQQSDDPNHVDVAVYANGGDSLAVIAEYNLTSGTADVYQVTSDAGATWSAMTTPLPDSSPSPIFYFSGTNTYNYVSGTTLYHVKIGTSPSAPTITSAGSATASSIVVSWSTPSAGSSPITDYTVEYSTDGATWHTFVSSPSTATTRTVTGLTSSQTYSFRVSAVSNDGTSAPSATVSAATLAATSSGGQTAAPSRTGTSTGSTNSTPSSDTTTPPATSDTTTPTIEESGNTLADGSTISSTPTFSGTANPYDTVTVTVHSDPVTCTATADASGKWSCQIKSALASGQHTVLVAITSYVDGAIQNLGPYTVSVPATAVMEPAAQSAAFPWWVVIAGIGLAVIIIAVVIARRIRK